MPFIGALHCGPTVWGTESKVFQVSTGPWQSGMRNSGGTLGMASAAVPEDKRQLMFVSVSGAAPRFTIL